MRLTYRAVAALSFLIAACAHPPKETLAAAACPLPDGTEGWPLSAVSADGSLSSTQLTAAARAVAEQWHREPPVYKDDDVPQDLRAYIALADSAPVFWRGPRAFALGDTATLAMTYRYRGSAVSASFASYGGDGALVKSLQDAATRAMREAASGAVARDTLPLPSRGQDSIVIYLALGHGPGPGDGVARFSRVESEPRTVPNTPAPRYPNQMRESGLNGHVLGAFVIDPQGRPIPSTFRVLSATRPEFSQAVREWLGHVMFQPAMRDCVSVSDLVVMPFDFTIGY